MRFERKNQVMTSRFFEPPGEFRDASRPGILFRLGVEIHAGQCHHMMGAGFVRVVERLKKHIACLLSCGGVGLIDRERDEVGIHLKENIRAPKAAVFKLSAQRSRGLDKL